MYACVLNFLFIFFLQIRAVLPGAKSGVAFFFSFHLSCDHKNSTLPIVILKVRIKKWGRDRLPMGTEQYESWRGANEAKVMFGTTRSGGEMNERANDSMWRHHR